MSCCGSKKRELIAGQRVPKQQGTTQSQVQIFTPAPNARPPASTIQFGADNFSRNTLNNPGSFILTNKVKNYAVDMDDRREDYSREVNTMSNSKLLESPNLLNYDLDAEDGVSKIPVINRFDYESQLRHCFLPGYKANSQIRPSQPMVQSGIRPTSSGVRNY